ncbi:MAG: UvrB/UvrC motif-containing protein [Leptospirales bacterium]|nr:UvrB/UvrC motif-containing protein [Leptospirales bacterium]
MLCERCKKEDAAIHLTEITRGKRSEVHLCDACAGEIGLNSRLSNFSISVPGMFSFVESDEQQAGELPLCGVCGTNFVIYAKQGKLGCPECYHYLEGPISGVIKSCHGDKKHSGKIPSVLAETEIIPETESLLNDNIFDIDELKEDLLAAVRDERYEDAALLRDRISLVIKDGVERN